MNPRFLLQSPENKPRWLVLFSLGLIAAFAIAVTTAYIKNSIAQTANLTLSVDVTADRHSISPDIYGMNDYALDPALAQELRIPVERWGANHTSRYNWLVDSSNSGDDFFFVGGGDNKNPIPGDSIDKIVKTNRKNGSKSIVTIMDNEPSGWGNTHRDVHPEATSYDELRDRTYEYASMVKATDPTAKE